MSISVLILSLVQYTIIKHTKMDVRGKDCFDQHILID